MIAGIARGALVLIVALLVGAAAYAFSERQPEEFESAASLAYGRLLSPELLVLGPDFAGEPDIDDDVRLATETSRVNSFDVAAATERAVPELGYTAGQIAAMINATPVRGSLVVDITARAPSPKDAQRLAGAYARAYLRRVRDRERSGARRVERILRTRLDELPPGDREGVIGASLRNQISTLAVLSRVGSGSPQVIESPRATSVPAQPQTTRNVLFGLLFGLVVGVGLVALRPDSRTRAAAAYRRVSTMARSEPARDR